MAKEYPNFYENIKEANMRLQYTVVLYDGEPYYVLTIVGGKPDGIFRVYMEPIGNPLGSVLNRIGGCAHDYPQDHPDKPKMMDDWMLKNPDCGVVRKTMNSPHFSKFRPFPLGMCNSGGRTYYLERQPQRHTQQGLTQQMLSQSSVGIETNAKMARSPVDIQGASFRNCVIGAYPSLEECVKNLSDPEIVNESVGFSRDFALVRGPINTMFISYKTDLIGFLPNGDGSEVRIANKFQHTKEVVEELRIFKRIKIN